MTTIKTSAYEQMQMFNPKDYPTSRKPLFDPNSIPDKPKTSGNLFEDLQYLGELGMDVRQLLDAYKVKYKDVQCGKHQLLVANLPDGQRYILNEDGDKTEVSEFIYGLGDWELFQYVDQKDVNAEFWEYPPDVVYHETKEENLKAIRVEGLEPRCETRGSSNRGMGCAVFCTNNKDMAETYTYPNGIVIEVLVGEMAKAGYKPRVGMEEPIEEAEACEALAHKLGVEDFHHDMEAGMESDTVVFYGHIPVQFLKIPDPEKEMQPQMRR